MSNIIFKVSEMGDVLKGLGVREKPYLKDGKPVKRYIHNAYTIVLADNQITIARDIQSSANVFRLSNIHVSKFIRHATQLVSEKYPDLNFTISHEECYKSFMMTINIPCKQRMYVSTTELLDNIVILKNIRKHFKMNTFYF